MSDIQFDEQQVGSSYHPPVSQQSKGIVGLIIKLGLAKNVAQANLVMIGIIIIMLMISFVSIRSMSDNPTPTEVDLSADPTEGMINDGPLTP